MRALAPPRRGAIAQIASAFPQMYADQLPPRSPCLPFCWRFAGESPHLFPNASLARRLLFLVLVNEDCGSPDRSSPLKAGVQGQALSPHCGLGAVVALRLTKPPSDRPREIADTITQGNKGNLMSYLVPSEFVTKMVDAGEAKVFMSTRDTVIRAYMAGAILALAAWFAVTINTNTGHPIVGALLFPVGFCMLYLLGFDLLTGVFVLTPLALLDKRPGVTLGGVLRNWGLVFIGNFAGAFTVAVLMAIYATYGFSTEPNAVGKALAAIGENRTLGYAKYGAAGMLTLFVRGMLCNWM